MNFDVVGKVSDGYIVKPQKECEKCYKAEKEEFCPNCDITTSSEILANQNKILITPHLKEFDIESLENKSSNETFEFDESIPMNNQVNITPAWNLACTGFAEPIRKFKATGELSSWRTAELIENAKRDGLNEEETEKYIQEAKEKYAEEIEKEIKSANEAIDSYSPTKTPHTVYRVIQDGYDETSQNYFKKMASLEKGEKVIISPTTMFASTSAKKTMGNYAGMGANDSVLFKINLPEGSKVLRLPSGDGIEQLLMKANAEFRVVDNQEYKNNFHLIELDYIPEEDC